MTRFFTRNPVTNMSIADQLACALLVAIIAYAAFAVWVAS